MLFFFIARALAFSNDAVTALVADDSLGDVSEPVDTDAFKQSQDNLYSYAPAEPQ